MGFDAELSRSTAISKLINLVGLDVDSLPLLASLLVVKTKSKPPCYLPI